MLGSTYARWLVAVLASLTLACEESSAADPALVACGATTTPSRVVEATEDPESAPRVEPSLTPMLVRVPGDGRGLIRIDLEEPRSIMVFTRQPRQARRIVAPTVVRVGATAIDTSGELCGTAGRYQAMGRAGSNEHCRRRIQEHLYYDAIDPGAHYLEITGDPEERVWLMLTWADGHGFTHWDEHAHHR